MTDIEIALKTIDDISEVLLEGRSADKKIPYDILKILIAAKFVIKDLVYYINCQKVEIERLEKDRDGWRNTAYHEASNAENLSNKIIIEFSERYKTEVAKRYEDIAYKDLFFGVVDNLVKEMVGEKQ